MHNAEGQRSIYVTFHIRFQRALPTKAKSYISFPCLQQNHFLVHIYLNLILTRVQRENRISTLLLNTPWTPHSLTQAPCLWITFHFFISTCMLTYDGREARRALSEFCWAAAALSAARSLPGAFLSANGLSVALSSGSESSLSVLLWNRVRNLTLHYHIRKCWMFPVCHIFSCMFTTVNYLPLLSHLILTTPLWGR